MAELTVKLKDGDNYLYPRIKADSIPDGIITSDKLDQALQSTINDKVSKENGKGLSSNDFTDAYKDKLEGIAVSNAKVTINQGGVQKGVLTLNQTDDVTIDLDKGSSANVYYPTFSIYDGDLYAESDASDVEEHVKIEDGDLVFDFNN